MTEINLIGGFYLSKTRPWSAQDVVNWAPVKSAAGGTRSPYKLRGLPGLRQVEPPITVVEALAISGDAPSGFVGEPYSHTYTASGGTPSYTFSLSDGTFPAGLSMNSSGAVSGTPTVAGVSGFTVTVFDAGGRTASLADSIQIISTSALDVFALLSFDGNFADQTGKVWTQSGTPSTDSTSFRFGSASANLSGSSGINSPAVLSTPPGTVLNNGGDWTMECWVFTASEITTYQPIIHIDSASAPSDILSLRISQSGSANNQLYFGVTAGTGAPIPYTLPLGQFVHIAIVRERQFTRIYAGGVKVFEDSGLAPAFVNASIYLGRIDRIFGPSTSFSGRIDEFRFVRGTAIYTGNFTPPSAPFPPP